MVGPRVRFYPSPYCDVASSCSLVGSFPHGASFPVLDALDVGEDEDLLMRKTKMLKRLSEVSSIRRYATTADMQETRDGVELLAMRVMSHITTIQQDVATLSMLMTVLLTTLEDQGIIQEVDMEETVPVNVEKEPPSDPLQPLPDIVQSLLSAVASPSQEMKNMLFGMEDVGQFIPKATYQNIETNTTTFHFEQVPLQVHHDASFDLTSLSERFSEDAEKEKD